MTDAEFIADNYPAWLIDMTINLKKNANGEKQNGNENIETI